MFFVWAFLFRLSPLYGQCLDYLNIPNLTHHFNDLHRIITCRYLVTHKKNSNDNTNFSYQRRNNLFPCPQTSTPSIFNRLTPALIYTSDFRLLSLDFYVLCFGLRVLNFDFYVLCFGFLVLECVL